MSEFLRQMAAARVKSPPARWLYVPYDQLTDQVGPLADVLPAECGIVLVESTWKAGRRPYHQQKLALILANQRHFALEQAQRGVPLRYEFTDQPYAETLAQLAGKLGVLQVMEPAERELRHDLQSLVKAGQLQVLPHAGWLTTADDFATAFAKGPPYRMDAFYRQVRRRTGILMQRGKPVGGKFSFDAENRQAWSGQPPAPTPPSFVPDAITQEVGQLVATKFGDHPGRLNLSQLPATRADAEAMWQWAIQHALPLFGPYEDAMSVRSRSLFHSRMSALVNIHRVLPQRMIDDVLSLDIPLASKEGFVRQLLGWREFVRHVHVQTDGFRTVAPVNQADAAVPAYLSADHPLPPAYWGVPSGLHCLDTVVADVWEEGYSHHITRLMVLSNIATLLDISPRELTDWFWVAYTDAFDWVVEPNVLGMGTYALGDLMTTKPYISGAAYINKMSDYCGGCAFNPKTNCPLTRLYWAFLQRHRDELASNMRMKLPLSSSAKRSHTDQSADAQVFEAINAQLAAAKRLSPETLASV
jgi:deoxyribodipyrimidine photolyase-related protein